MTLFLEMYSYEGRGASFPPRRAGTYGRCPPTPFLTPSTHPHFTVGCVLYWVQNVSEHLLLQILLVGGGGGGDCSGPLIHMLNHQPCLCHEGFWELGMTGIPGQTDRRTDRKTDRRTERVFLSHCSDVVTADTRPKGCAQTCPPVTVYTTQTQRERERGREKGREEKEGEKTEMRKRK